ncbi:MAG TPA: hypothetical protein VIY27_03930 [Myxococcota bacterium]
MFLQSLTYILVIVVNLAVGWRLFQQGRRQGKTPELLLGASLTLDGIEWLFWVLAMQSPAAGTPLADVFGIACRVGVAGHNICLLAFTRLVFRPQSRAALAGVLLVSTVLVASLLVGIGLGDRLGYRSDRVWIWLEVGAQQVAYAWTCAESMLHYTRTRRRVQLGLCDPVVANRFLLWGVYGGATLLCALAYLTSIGVATHAGEYPFFLDVLMIVPTVFAALALWLAFFPSRAYRSWLTAGTGDASL